MSDPISMLQVFSSLTIIKLKLFAWVPHRLGNWEDGSCQGLSRGKNVTSIIVSGHIFIQRPLHFFGP